MGKKIAFLGIDLGTTGIRAVLSDEKGNIISVQSAGVLESIVDNPDGRVSEQDPGYWEKALSRILGNILSSTGEYLIKAIAVDSTSGTIIPIDKQNRPLHNAILHNDVRAQEESDIICQTTGLNVKPSFALSKILWIKNNYPEIFEKTWKFVHAADYIRGLLSGDFAVTDFSNAVKTGYDLELYRWPESIGKVLCIPHDKLPEVVKTGEVVGEFRKELRDEFGMEERVPIVAGATDSTTSFYSSGAERIGDWNTTLGTVLGIRGISSDFIVDPEGLLYAHRHPEGFWLPGAASNTGGEGIRLFFGDKLEEYDKLIMDMPPTGFLIYPLVRKSEKFPFMNMEAVGFIRGTLTNPHTMFKGFLEGIAFVERMIYEKIESIGYTVGGRIFSMGGGACSSPWMQIRADTLKRTICRSREVEAAFGAAIIAASGVHYDSMTEAIENMVNIDTVVEPDSETARAYDDIYGRFLFECRERGLF